MAGGKMAWLPPSLHPPLVPHHPRPPNLLRFQTLGHMWTSLKRKSMQFGLNASFFKNLIFLVTNH